MSARVIDGRAIATQIKAETAMSATEIANATGKQPGLATVLVGDDAASRVYVSNKRKGAADCGIADFHQHLSAGATQAQVAGMLRELAAAPEVSGILLQLPLPEDLDASTLIDLIPPEKDVDGLTTLNQGLLARGQSGLRPCTPSGVMRLLTSADVNLAGAEAVVVGRSELVGRPMAHLLLQANATVTVTHSRTENLDRVTRRADVVIAAAGVPHLIGAHHIKPGTAVIDVGIHRSATGLIGDVKADEVAPLAGVLTRVPGGVGPMTIAMLLANTVTAARRQQDAARSEGAR